MYEVKTQKSVKLGGTFVADVDGEKIEITWKPHQLVDEYGDARQILGMWVEDNVRTFCSLEPFDGECEYCAPQIPIPEKEKGESVEHFACRKTEAVISRHGLAPAVNGRHKITHLLALENPDSFIPCRKSLVEVPVGKYEWQRNYEKAAVATS
jgi:hypothetical protein